MTTQQIQVIKWALMELEMNAPQMSHTGPCGPEAGCDASCQDASSFADQYNQLKKLIQP